MKTNQLNLRAFIGVIFSIPAALIVVPGIAQSLLGVRGLNDALDSVFEKADALRLVIHPAVVLGGLAIALGMNVLPMINMRINPEDASPVGAISIKNKAMNLAAIVLAGLLLAAILAYAIGENFIPIPGSD